MAMAICLSENPNFFTDKNTSLFKEFSKLEPWNKKKEIKYTTVVGIFIYNVNFILTG